MDGYILAIEEVKHTLKVKFVGGDQRQVAGCLFLI